MLCFSGFELYSRWVPLKFNQTSSYKGYWLYFFSFSRLIIIFDYQFQQPAWLLIGEPFCGKMFPSLAARETKCVDRRKFVPKTQKNNTESGQ